MGEMNYEEFIDKIDKIAKLYFKDGQANIISVNKNNGIVLKGLTIYDETNIAPTLYLEKFYESYKDGKPFSDVCEEIFKEYQNIWQDNKLEYIPDITNYEQVKDNIIIRVVNYEANKELLSNMPFNRLNDLAVTYRILVSNDDHGIASAAVTNREMERWNVKLEDMHNRALKNTQVIFPAKIQRMDDMFKDMLGDEYALDDVHAEETLYIISNEQGINGASVVMYDNVLADLRAKIGDFYILPSSIHEVLCISVKSNMDIGYMTNMVREANATVVRPDEMLSESVYAYNGKAIVLAHEYESSIDSIVEKFMQDTIEDIPDMEI